MSTASGGASETTTGTTKRKQKIPSVKRARPPVHPGVLDAARATRIAKDVAKRVAAVAAGDDSGPAVAGVSGTRKGPAKLIAAPNPSADYLKRLKDAKRRAESDKQSTTTSGSGTGTGTGNDGGGTTTVSGTQGSLEFTDATGDDGDEAPAPDFSKYLQEAAAVQEVHPFAGRVVAPAGAALWGRGVVKTAVASTCAFAMTYDGNLMSWGGANQVRR